MRKRTIVRRMLAFALAVSMILTGLPSSLVSAKEADLEEEKLKVELAKGAAENPKGVFGFYITQLSGIEGKKLEIQVVRQGGTEGKASVDFKAIDIMSSYGKDYLMTVKESDSKERVLPVNPDAKPLMELYGDNLTTGDNEAGKTTEDTQDAKADEKETATQLPTTQSVEPATSALSKLSANGEVGKQSSWRELNQKDEAYENVEKMMGTSEESSKEFLEKLEGVGCTLDFTDGEYKKTIEVELIDDEEEESDEQLMFYLSSAMGAKLGENYNGYLNIRDNEESSGACFEMAESKVALVSGDDAMRIKVKRTQGVNLMSVISVGTKSDTAIAGTDYEAVKEDLVFAPGMKEKEIVIPILNTNREKDLTFYVGLDEESAMVNNEKKVTLVTLQATSETVKDEEGTGTIGEGQDYSHKIYPDKWFSMNNGFNSAAICKGLDLRLATEVKVTFTSTDGYTTYKDKRCVEHTDYGRYVEFSIYNENTGKHIVWSEKPCRNSFNNYVLSMPVDTTSSSLTLYSYVTGAGNNLNASVHVTQVEITYPGYTFTVNNSYEADGFSTNGYRACNYEGSAASARTYDNSITQLGVAHVEKTGVNTPTDQVTVYRVCDNLQFSWNYAKSETANGAKPDYSNATFEGYQLKKRNTTNTWSETIKADKMDIMSLVNMKDYILDNNNFTVRPVFKVKEQDIKFYATESKASYSGYNSNSTLRVKAFDTVKVSAVPKAGYAVSKVYAYFFDWAKSLLPDSKTEIKFIAAESYFVHIDTQDSFLTVMKDPNGSNTDKGYILYYDKDNPNNSKTTQSGSMTILKTVMLQSYRLIAITNEGNSQYHVKWRDGTADVDGMGKISEYEKKALKDYKGFKPVGGDMRDVIMNYPKIKIYYDFYIPNAASSSSALEGRVSIRDKEIFTGRETTKGINNVTVSASSMDPVLTETSVSNRETKQEDGYFCLEGEGMTPYDYYLVNVNAPTSHGGSLVCSVVMNPDDFEPITLNPEDDIYVNTSETDRSKAKVFRLGKDWNNKETETEVSPAELVTGVRANPITYRIRVQ